MTEWKQKRFWTEVSVVPAPGGHAVELDGRAVRTPAKAPLVLPTRALAEDVAAEWRAQEGRVDPQTMPATRTANSAIDKVRPQQAEVVAALAAYGAHDLLCYRAATPPELVARQAAGWDPLLDWAARDLGAPLAVTTGVLPVAQDPQVLERLAARVARFGPFALAGFHDLVMLSGSLILALAVTEGRLPAEEAWALSRIDEDWQAELWGSDEEAAAVAEAKRAAFLDAARFHLRAS